MKNMASVLQCIETTKSFLENSGAEVQCSYSKEYAYTHQWFTPEKCIEESEEIFQDFLDRGQDTLYALDWDYATFEVQGTVNQDFVFRIPVYENIPTYNDEEYEAFPDPNK